MDNIKKRWGIWVGLLSAGVLIMGYLISKIDIELLWNSLEQINVRIMLFGVFIYIVIILLRAWKWYFLSRFYGVRMSFIAFLSRYLIFYFVSSLTPLRSGDVFAPLVISKNGNYRKGLYQSLIMDRFLDMSILGLLSIFSLWYVIHFTNFILSFESFIIGILLLLLISICIVLSFKFWSTGFINKMKIFSTGLYQACLRLNKRTIIHQLMISSLVWFLDFCYIYTIIHSVGLKELEFIHSLVSQVGSTIFSILTFVPAGIGTGAISYSFIGTLFHYSEALLIIGTVLAKFLFLLTITTLAGIGYGIFLFVNRKEEWV